MSFNDAQFNFTLSRKVMGTQEPILPLPAAAAEEPDISNRWIRAPSDSSLLEKK
jgi:hypothetical protein